MALGILGTRDHPVVTAVDPQGENALGVEIRGLRHPEVDVMTRFLYTLFLDFLGFLILPSKCETR